MKFSFDKTIDDVLKFDVNHTGLHYLTKAMVVPSILDLDLDLAKEGLDVDDYASLFLSGDFICIVDGMGCSIALDLKNDQDCVFKNIEDAESGYSLLDASTDNPRELVRANMPDGISSGYIWNVDSNEQKPVSINYSYWLNSGRYLIKRDVRENTISLISQDDSLLWTHQFTGTALNGAGKAIENDLASLIGIHNELLWLTDRADCIFSIDVNTGKIVHSSNQFGNTYMYKLEREKNRLIALQHSIFHVVDIDNKTLSHRSTELSEMFKEFGFSPNYSGVSSEFPVIDSHFVFFDAYEFVVAVFDIEKEEVTWHQELSSVRGNGAIRIMKYYDNMMYIWCTDNSLHLFKRTN